MLLDMLSRGTVGKIAQQRIKTTLKNNITSQHTINRTHRIPSVRFPSSFQNNSSQSRTYSSLVNKQSHLLLLKRYAPYPLAAISSPSVTITSTDSPSQISTTSSLSQPNLPHFEVPSIPSQSSLTDNTIQAKDDLSDKAYGALDTTTEYIDNSTNTIHDTVTHSIDDVNTGIEHISDSIDNVSGHISSHVSSLENTIENVKDDIVDTTNSVIDTASDVLSSVHDSLNDAVESTQDIFYTDESSSSSSSNDDSNTLETITDTAHDIITNTSEHISSSLSSKPSLLTRIYDIFHYIFPSQMTTVYQRIQDVSIKSGITLVALTAWVYLWDKTLIPSITNATGYNIWGTEQIPLLGRLATFSVFDWIVTLSLYSGSMMLKSTLEDLYHKNDKFKHIVDLVINKPLEKVCEYINV